MDLFVQKFGSKIYKEKEHFIVEKKGETKEYFSYSNVENVVVTEGCLITTDFLIETFEKELSIYLADSFGKIKGKIIPITYDTNSTIREKQGYIFRSEYGIKIGKNWIVEKIENQKKHLKKIYSRRKEIEKIKELEEKFDICIAEIEKISVLDEQYENKIMGYEGISSVLYYEHIRSNLPETWSFKKRETQGAKEPYNIALNYAFGILYFKIEKYLTLAGLDIQLGILHSSNNNKKSLVFDFIEPFRVICWESIFSLFTKKQLNKSYFNSLEGKIEAEGKKKIAQDIYTRLNNIVEYNGKKVRMEEKIKIRAKELAKELLDL